MNPSTAITASFLALVLGVILILAGVALGTFPVIAAGSVIMMVGAGGLAFGASGVGSSDRAAETH